MRYPIDQQTTNTFLSHIVAHERAQRDMIQAFNILLSEATESMRNSDLAPEDYPDWYDEAEKLLILQKKLKLDHDNRIFNEKNGHYTGGLAEGQMIASFIGAAETIRPNGDGTETIVPGIQNFGQIKDPQVNANINEREKALGEELSEADIARMFGEKTKKKLTNGVDLSAKEPFKGMSIEQIEEWEQKQDNSNDIYKVKARVSNLAAATGGSLTAVGEMMVNSFVHVVKDLYDFADTIQDKSLRIQLIERVKKHEGMPGALIDATKSGVKIKK